MASRSKVYNYFWCSIVLFPEPLPTGITGGYGGDRRVEYIIPPEARKEGVHEFIIESSCNGMFGVPWNGDTIQPPDMNRFFSLASADLVVPNMEAWGLLWDFQTLRELVDSLPGNTPFVLSMLLLRMILILWYEQAPE
jgi:hypothetical protein